MQQQERKKPGRKKGEWVKSEEDRLHMRAFSITYDQKKFIEDLPIKNKSKLVRFVLDSFIANVNQDDELLNKLVNKLNS